MAVLVTTDGSIGDIKRQSYEAAERETVMQLESSGKPFVIVVNTTKPFAAETRLLCESLSREYKAAAIPIDCENFAWDRLQISWKSSYMNLQSREWTMIYRNGCSFCLMTIM